MGEGVLRRAAFWIGPAATAVLATAFYGPFGYGRDFGAFVIAVFFILPGLGVMLIGLAVWWALERRPGRRRTVLSLFLTALAPAVLIPGLWVFGESVRDPARLAVWSALHRRALDAARERNGVFFYWDSWGMAGMENDSYLASDPTDTLSRAGAAQHWAQAHGLGCPIVRVRRVERGVYVIATSNCMLRVPG